MARNGSGVYNLPAANYPAVAGTTITAANRNAVDSDIATALTGSVATNGESVITNDIPMSNNKVTGLKTGTAATDATNLGQVQSGASTVLNSVSGTDTITATLSPTLTAYASGQMFKLVPANTNTGAVTININSLGAKAITKNGETALVAGDLVAGVVYILEYDGTQFQAIAVGLQTQITALDTEKADLAGATFTGDVVMSGAMIKWAKGADVASATALPLITDGNYFDVTGTTTITSFNTVGVGAVVKLHFDGALTLTHHATDLILPSGANIVTAAGDEAEFVEYATGDWRCTNYTPTSGKALVGSIVLNSAVTLSTTSTTISSSIPSTAKEVTLFINGASLSGTDEIYVRLIDSTPATVITGYSGSVAIIGDGSTAVDRHSTAFRVPTGNGAATWVGSITFKRTNPDTHVWAASYNIGRTDADNIFAGGGLVTLSTALTGMVMTVSGSNTYDAGTASISWS